MNFYEVFKAEAKAIFTDISLVLTIIGGVILYAFLYPQPYLNEVTTNLSISVVDLDKTDVSRDLVFDLDATAKLAVTSKKTSVQEAKKALIKGDISGFIIIPKHFKRDLELNRRPTIYIGADASYFLVYGGVVKGALGVILTLNEKVKIVENLVQTQNIKTAQHKSSSFSVINMNIFNPEVSYLQYVVPAVFVLLLQQMMLIGMGLVGGGQNELRKQGLRGYYTDAKIQYRILARMSIFMGVFFVHILFYFGFVFEAYGISHVAKIGDLINFSIAFLMASASLGLLFSTLLSNKELATPLVLFSSLPFVFSAGFVWPVESLPLGVQLGSLFVPSTLGIEGFLKLNQMGSNFDGVMLEYGLLWLQTCLYLSASVLVMRKQKLDEGK